MLDFSVQCTRHAGLPWWSLSSVFFKSSGVSSLVECCSTGLWQFPIWIVKPNFELAPNEWIPSYKLDFQLCFVPLGKRAWSSPHSRRFLTARMTKLFKLLFSGISATWRTSDLISSRVSAVAFGFGKPCVGRSDFGSPRHQHMLSTNSSTVNPCTL